MATEINWESKNFHMFVCNAKHVPSGQSLADLHRPDKGLPEGKIAMVLDKLSKACAAVVAVTRMNPVIDHSRVFVAVDEESSLRFYNSIKLAYHPDHVYARGGDQCQVGTGGIGLLCLELAYPKRLPADKRKEVSESLSKLLLSHERCKSFEGKVMGLPKNLEDLNNQWVDKKIAQWHKKVAAKNKVSFTDGIVSAHRGLEAVRKLEMEARKMIEKQKNKKKLRLSREFLMSIKHCLEGSILKIFGSDEEISEVSVRENINKLLLPISQFSEFFAGVPPVQGQQAAAGSSQGTSGGSQEVDGASQAAGGGSQETEGGAFE